MADSGEPLTSLTINHRWYQQVSEMKSMEYPPKAPGPVTFWFKGPLDKWKSEFCSELINNPRLIAYNINIIYPPKEPTQGTWDTPESELNKLPPLLQSRIRFVDKDLKYHLLAERIIKPIKDDFLGYVGNFRDVHESINQINRNCADNLDRIQAVLRGLMISIHEKSMFDIAGGLHDLTYFLIHVDRSKLSSESRIRLSTIESYFENYYRVYTGPMALLHPVGPDRAAPDVLNDIVKNVELELISERNRIGQISGLTEFWFKQFGERVSSYLKKNERYISTAVQTGALICPPAANLDKVLDLAKLLNMPKGTVPLLDLQHSRLYAMITELKCLRPIHYFENGRISIGLNLDFGSKNFFARMVFPMSMRDYKKWIISAEAKQNCTIDIGKPETEIK